VPFRLVVNAPLRLESENGSLSRGGAPGIADDRSSACGGNEARGVRGWSGTDGYRSVRRGATMCGLSMNAAVCQSRLARGLPLSVRRMTRLPTPLPASPLTTARLASFRAKIFSRCWALCDSIRRAEALVGFWRIAGMRSLGVSRAMRGIGCKHTRTYGAGASVGVAILGVVELFTLGPVFPIGGRGLSAPNEMTMCR
jgi:hypothetical protein